MLYRDRGISQDNISDLQIGRLHQKAKENVRDVLSRLGFSVTYVPNREIADNVIGYADITNREVYLSPEHIDDALMMHELTHVIDRGFNNGYIKSLLSFFKKNFSSEWDKAIKKAEENYKNIPGANLEAEALADMCMRLAEDNYIVKKMKDIKMSFTLNLFVCSAIFTKLSTTIVFCTTFFAYPTTIRGSFNSGSCDRRKVRCFSFLNRFFLFFRSNSR